MNRCLSLLLSVSLVFTFTSSAFAQANDEDDIGSLPLEQPKPHRHQGVQPLEQPESRITPDDHHYPTNLRLMFLAQVSAQASAPRDPAAGGQGTIELGHGLITGEAGLTFFSARADLSVSDTADGSKHAFTSLDHFVGLPLLLKINYIQMPQASLSLKLGVMPSVAVKDTSKLAVGDSAGKPYDMSRSDTFAVIGFTGAAPMGDDTEFIVDGAYNMGLTNLDKNGAHHKTIALGIGVRLDL